MEDKNVNLAEVAIPSVTILCYQLLPGFENRHTSARYKGRFDVIFKIQRRQIRSHEEAHSTLTSSNFFYFTLQLSFISSCKGF